MLEEKTIEVIQAEMLENIDNSFEKSVGYGLYETIKSFAIESSNLYKAISLLVDKTDVDKLKDDELDKFILQRKGLTRKQASKAVGILSINGVGTINVGDLFETQNSTQFRATETKSIDTTGTINIEALIGGNVGNVGANSITQIPVTLTGITSVNNIISTHDGYDAESDNSFRDRYYTALRQPPTSGNIYTYINWAKEITGVGDAKCVPLWNGANTVKVIIIDSNNLVASEDLVAKVQNYIDPNITGTGLGVAPIGAYTTVISATNKPISISIKLNLLNGYVDTTVKAIITNIITQYLKDIAFKQDYVSFAKIGALILSVDGVKDYTDLLVNDGDININVGSEEVATLTSVVLT